MKKISSLYLLFLFISFVGFVYETILAIALDFSDLDRGFLSLPLCPIYGSGVILTYLIFGIPKKMRIFKYQIKTNNKIKLYLYFLLSAVLATLLEFIIGTFFEKAFDIVLWEYTSLKFSFGKYCSLLPSICWGLAITIFMNNLFEKLYNKFQTFRKENLVSISIVSLILILIDVIILIFEICETHEKTIKELKV